MSGNAAHQVTVSLSPKQKADVKEAADRQMMSVSSYLRRAGVWQAEKDLKKEARAAS